MSRSVHFFCVYGEGVLLGTIYWFVILFARFDTSGKVLDFKMMLV